MAARSKIHYAAFLVAMIDTKYMPSQLPHGQKWFFRLLALLGIQPKDSQSTIGIPLLERVKVAIAAFITLFLVTWVSLSLQDPQAATVLLASMGASAVIIFALPSSPLAKTWNFMASHSLACLVGLGMTYVVHDFALMAGFTVAAILMLMYIFQCIHPPAAATALVPVIASQSGGVNYTIITSVAINLVVFSAVSILLNRFVLQRASAKLVKQYDPIHLHQDHTPLKRLGLQTDDLMHAINSFDSVVDISEQDLEQIYQQAQLHAYQKRCGEILSRDIMSQDLITINQDASLGTAWKLLQKHKISMLPVINSEQELLGVISSTDFLKQLTVPSYAGLLRHLNALLIKRKHNDEIQNRVQDLMVTNVTVVKDSDHIVALVPLLSDIGLHHIPVLDAQQKLCGIITQSDLIGALYAVHNRQY
ncbi:HPP family protein [Motilimonas sp. 1_MG-2023]|uniref:HPP family protein n=1 Tax=Motilimonas sp. 1_MG-2023 TaxID=3062672 RepID=UPI0026E16789|nr:CBS domain-containing protein [Motilimonas sp. 1_MG-2023]MDO6527840.1 HPP family protein [Motilimonas sp. 1_MG-2023]